MGEKKYETYNNTIDLIAFIRFVLRRSYFVICGVVIGIIAAILINTATVKPTYSCEAKYYLTASEDIVSYGALQATTTIMQDYLVMIKSKSIVERAIDRDGLNIDTETALEMINVSNPEETRLLIVTVKSQDRQQAEALMNAISYQIINYLPSIMEGSSLYVFEDVNTSLDDVISKKTLNIVLSVIVFAAIAVVILLIQFMTRTTVENPEDISRVTGGIRTYLFPGEKKSFFLRSDKKQKALEKSLDSSVTEIVYDLTLGTNRSGTILVTSIDEGNGGSFVAHKLYDSLCKAGSDVLFIDRDLTQLQETDSDRKTITEKSSALVMEQRGSLSAALDRLKDSHDFIIIDSEPVLQNVEPLVLAKHIDKVVMTVEHGHTSMQDLEKGIRRFRDNNLTVHAIVLNM